MDDHLGSGQGMGRYKLIQMIIQNLLVCKSLSTIASPVTPVSPWYDLAMSLDLHYLPCFMFRCALESVID